MHLSSAGDPQLLIPDLCPASCPGFDVDHMRAHNGLFVELTQGHILCLCLGAPQGGIKG